MLKEDFEELLKKVKKKFPVMKIKRVISTPEGTVKEAEVIVFRGKKSITLNVRNYIILAERDFKYLEFYTGK